MVVFGQKRLYSGKVIVIRQIAVFGQKYFSSGKVVDLGQK